MTPNSMKKQGSGSVKKIRNGELEDRKIDIDVKQPNTSGIGMIGGGMMDESSMINLQEMLGNMLPKKSKKRKVTIGEARKILLEDEVSKLIDMDEVKEEAIERAENSGIIFIDEVDKIAGNSSKGSGPMSVGRCAARFASDRRRQHRKHQVWHHQN
jgi:ATP-dependent HslUV protease ATP-binding subunit HslU